VETVVGRNIVLIIALFLTVGVSYLFLRANGVFTEERHWIQKNGLELRAWRGAPDYLPSDGKIEFTLSGVFENTLEAIQRALARDFKTVQLDVRMTADEYLVVIHDSTLDRTTDGTGLVRSMSFAQLKAHVLKTGAPVPTLEEVFMRFGPTGHFQLELFEGSLFSPLVERTLEAIRRYELEERVSIASRYPWILGMIENAAPKLDTELIIVPSTDDGGFPMSPDTWWLNFYRIDGVQLRLEQLSPMLVEKYHNQGLYVVARGINTLGDLKIARAAKVDIGLTFFSVLEAEAQEIPPHKLVDERLVTP